MAANLVELEIDSSRQLLEARALSGESAVRWAAASAALTDLWGWRERFDAFLAHAQELRRSPRRADELNALLTGPSIELTRSQVPLAERDLLGEAEVAVRCTPDELLERMSGVFDDVKTVVAQFAYAWESLSPRLTAARETLTKARELAASLGESDRADLIEAADHVDRLSAELSADPLTVRPDDARRLIESLEAIRRDLEATLALRGELDARLGEARALLTRLRTVAEEGRAVHEELVVKIAVPSAPPGLEPGEDLDAELDQIVALARAGGAWREARRRLDAWTAHIRALLDDAERILSANRTPLEARNQLRALLEAYQVKASRLGAIENPELERIFAQAHAALHTAPTDLAAAAQLVRRYQEILNAPRPAPEVVR